MAKKKSAAPVNSVAEQIKALIDAGDFSAAQVLISGEMQNATSPPKKRGCPPKETKETATKQVKQVKPKTTKTKTVKTVKTTKKESPKPPPSPSPANNNSNSGFTSCIAPSKSTSGPTKKTVSKGGKEYTVSRKVEWAPPEGKNKFKDKVSYAPRDLDLQYPERSERRDPVEQITYICYQCDKKELLYPGQGPDEDMLYTCTRCAKKNRPR